MSVDVEGAGRAYAKKLLLGENTPDVDSLIVACGEETESGGLSLSGHLKDCALCQKKVRGIALPEIIYYIAWALLVVSELLLRYNCPSSLSVLSDTLVDVLHGIAFLLLAAKALLSWYSGVRQIVFVVALGGIAVCSSLAAKTLTMTGIFIMLVASKGASFNKVALIQTIIIVVGVILGFVLYKAGLLLDDSALRVDGDPTSLMRHSVGFKHPNMLATLVLFAICAFSAYKGMSISVLHLLIFSLLGILVYFVTGSRTASGMIFVFVLLCALWRIKKLRLVIAAAVAIVLVLGIGLSLYLMVNFKWTVPWHEMVNNLLTQRCYLMNQYYEMYGMTLFGAGFAPPSNMPLDNAYARLLLQNGVIPFVVMMGLIVTCFVRGIRKERTLPYLLIFCFLCCFGLMEYYVFSILNFSLLFIPAMLYGPLHDGTK